MSSDQIKLVIPAKPEYVMIVRLTSAAVASRAGFDVDEIEDIKMAVAEAIILIISQLSKPENLSVGFTIDPRGISINISGGDIWEDSYISTHDIGQAQLSKFILSSMMDKIDFKTDKGIMSNISMHKNLGV